MQNIEHRCLDNVDYIGKSKYSLYCTVCNKVFNNQLEQEACCGEIVGDCKEAFYVCNSCGKVHIHYMMEGTGELENDYVKEVYPVKKRHYHSFIHFLTHVKRYIGDVHVHIDDELYKDISKKINVKYKDAYSKVRQYLKERKLSKYYKAIYMIIYKCGGYKPKISSKQFEQLKQDFKSLQRYFYENSGKTGGYNDYGCLIKVQETKGKFNRKSMPSLSMLLDILLRKNGHTPYYEIPYLKDPDLRNRVLKFYECHTNDIIKPWAADGEIA